MYWLTKISLTYSPDIIEYKIYSIDGIELDLNKLIGKNLEISVVSVQCLDCKYKKLYRQGLCYKCYNNNPNIGDWVFHPEKSKSHLGLSEKNIEIESKFQLQDHVVYLSYTSDLKVGVTKLNSYLTRWMDQGAIVATILLKVPNRYLAGIAEVELKKHLKDKTYWKKMLNNSQCSLDWNFEFNRISNLVPDNLRIYLENKSNPINIHYPIIQNINIEKTINLAKTNRINAKLIGLKGQYLLFDNNCALNIRNHAGYCIDINC